MKKLEVFSQKLEAPIREASIIFMAVIVLGVFIEVISRYIFQASHGFVEDFAKWSQVWFGFLMIGLLVKWRRHISIDLLFRRLPEKYQPALTLIIDFVVLGFAIFLLCSGVMAIQAIYMAKTASATELEIPFWIVRLCIPLGALFLSFFAAQNVAEDIAALNKGKEGVE